MIRNVLLALVVLLYVASIPWYRDADSPVAVWFGLPDWVTVALGCYLAVACLNAWAWYRSDVPDAESPPPTASPTPPIANAPPPGAERP